MKAILFREIKTFFGSPIGYLVIAIFLLLNGLFLWVFEGDFNIANSGFADLNPFFTLAPWILIFLIPAVTMRSFSDERKQGTLELLLTKPLSIWQIVNGKFSFAPESGPSGTYSGGLFRCGPARRYAGGRSRLARDIRGCWVGSWPR